MLRAEECYSTAEVASLLSTTREKVGWYRQFGLIKGTKTGKGYTYRASNINRFLELVDGADISNRQKIKAFAKRKGLITGAMMVRPKQK